MKLTVVGSANAFNASGRGHSCYWLDGAVSGGLMVDFGATALYGIQKAGRSVNELSGLVFTHLHGDHIGGFTFFYIDAMYVQRRTAPLTVVGPVGIRQRLIDLVRVTYGDLADREPPCEIRWHELRPGERQQLEELTIEGFPAEHMDPPELPLCLRLTGPGGETVAFSGDTRMCDGLRAAGDGVDLLVAECTTLDSPAGRHCTWEDWQVELTRTTARRVLLTHLGSDVRSAIPELLAAAPEGVDLAFADDGLILEV